MPAIELAMSVTTTTPASAPKPAATHAVASASEARPCLASGHPPLGRGAHEGWPAPRRSCPGACPSTVVATDEGSPGMLKRMEVVDPPNSAPQYIDERTMI